MDGVPNPFEEVQEAKIDTLATLQDYIVNLTPIIREPKIFVHQPYKEKECNDCHNPNSIGKLNAPLKELCFNCHDNFNNIYPMLHGPVASANCTKCHNPHKSKIKGLLLEEGNDLCFNCHDEQKIVRYPIHKTIEDASCTDCHNPHGGATNYLLQKNACYECHENFEDNYTNLHGPVAAGGLCTTCHESHSSTKPNLLKFAGKELCLNCHLSTDIYKSIEHNTTKKQNCTNCHNPHGSNEHYLLTKTVAE